MSSRSFDKLYDDLLPEIKNYISSIESDFNRIPEERKRKLRELSTFLHNRKLVKKSSDLIFICTHNSRRSHMSQLWAQTAAYFYSVTRVSCYSGGTEATMFNPRAIKALQKAGFEIEQSDSGTNPVYLVKYSMDMEPIKVFSKKIEDDPNPKEDFIAVMTCSDADEACPIVPGATMRFTLTYKDPKEADGTREEETRYDERCRQIASEMFYLFSLR